MNKAIIQYCITLIAFLVVIVLPGISFGQVQINSIQTTVSTCANNGTITVNATSPNTPLIYSIVAGPVTAPIQTNNVFNSLPSGTYTIKVSDASANNLTQTATIGGNYLQPDFAPIVKRPYCAGGSDGRLVGNNIPGTGKVPFTWQLIAPSPITTAPQSSDTFSNLTAGNYTMRLTDACGGFRTIVATIPDAPVSEMAFALPASFSIIGCDTGMIFMQLYTTLYRYPLTCTYTTASGSFTVVTPEQPDSSEYGSGQLYLTQVLPGFGYNDWVTVTITDQCGFTLVSPTYYSKPFMFCYGTYNYSSNCNAYSVANFDMNQFNCNPDNDFTTAMPPLTYEVTDVNASVIVASDTLLNQIVGFTLPPLPYNTAYSVEIIDGCGNIYNQDFIISEPDFIPPTIESKTPYPDACVDSAGFVFIMVNNFKTEPKLVFLSGPATMGSTKPGYEYSNSHAYPDTFPVRGFGGTYHRFDIYGVSPGTYQFKVFDDCGNELFDSLVIAPTDVTDFGHHFWYKKGCLGQNELHYTVNAADGNMIIQNPSTNLAQGTGYQTQNWVAGISDSLLNLPSGTYSLTFQYTSYFNSDTQLNEFPLTCQVISDSVVIEGYQTPSILNGNYIQCQSGIHLEIVPDSTKGVPPYQYEIISGPQIFPVQTSNIFDLVSPGVYTVRIYDVCGNGSTSEITVDPIIFPAVNIMPFSCNSTSLSYGSSAYYTYNWIMPNGTMYIGDTLTIDPITPADTGIYHIQQIVNINGCSDTFYTTHHLGLFNTYPQNITICNGSSVTIGTHTYNTTGIYSDTLTNVNSCDSIVVLNLTVVTFFRDSIIQSICAGQSYNFNGYVYTQTGIYHDTLSTATCDSIITLNLTVAGYIRDSITQSICMGDSYSVGVHIYNQTGIYQDTLSTAICDSILVLNLTVEPFKRDSINHSICAGESFTFNNQVYSQAGIYHDTLTTATCDSVVILNLTVEPLKHDSTNHSICAGESFTFNNQVYTQAGIYHDTLSTATCDSVVVLNLTVEPIKRDSINQSICAGESFTFNNQVYTQAGIYHDTLSTATCDSIVVLNLTVELLKRDSINHSICAGESFIFNNQVYTQAGVYHDTLSTATCDSIVVLNLTITPYKRDSLTRSVCAGESFTVNGHAYTQVGIYHDTLSTATCDSIVVLNLMVLPLKRDTINRSICLGESFTVNGHAYIQTGIYHDTLSTTTCDSIVVLNLTVVPLKHSSINQTICIGENFTFNGHVYTQTGDYSDTLSTSSCDSISTLLLTVIINPPIQISASATSVHEGDVINLGVTQSYSYLWASANALINNPVIQYPTASVSTSSWIYVNTTSDLSGCVSTDSIFILVYRDSTPCKGSYIYIPSAFTPNSDGLNDIVKIYSKKIALIRFQVFNRWGEKVFETENINTGWDGRHKGKIVAGAYVYMIGYYSACDTKQKMMKGSIVLIK